MSGSGYGFVDEDEAEPGIRGRVISRDGGRGKCIFSLKNIEAEGEKGIWRGVSGLKINPRYGLYQ